MAIKIPVGCNQEADTESKVFHSLRFNRHNDYGDRFIVNMVSDIRIG